MILKYEVEWDGDLSHVRYAQDFETIEEARIALALHHKRNAVLTVKQIREQIMGATLEFTKVKATTAKEAAVKIMYEGNETDPYSGWFNTCGEFVDKTYKIRESEFSDWVLNRGEKRVLYIIKISPTEYEGGAWCAC